MRSVNLCPLSNSGLGILVKEDRKGGTSAVAKDKAIRLHFNYNSKYNSKKILLKRVVPAVNSCLFILSHYFNVEITVVGTQSFHIDSFGKDTFHKERKFLIYDSIQKWRSPRLRNSTRMWQTIPLFALFVRSYSQDKPSIRHMLRQTAI